MAPFWRARSDGGTSDHARRYFEPIALGAGLKRKLFVGGAVAAGSQLAKAGLTLGATIVLARLLMPSDFGLVAMVTPIMAFVSVFRDLGLNAATIQRTEIDHGQVSTLFWINALVSTALALILVLAAPAVAWFYGEDRVVAITMAFSIMVALGGLAAQHQALLKRQMQFADLAKVELAALASGIAVAIAAAWAGAGYWALVLNHATMSIVNVGLSWTFCGWRPGWPKWTAEVRSMFAFGSNLTGFSVVNLLQRNLDNVLVGWRWGDSALGIYKHSYALLMLPISQINWPMTQVMVPALSRLKHDPAAYRTLYVRGLNLAVSAGMPLVAFTVLAADELVRIVLGEQWLGVIPVFRALAPAAFVGTFNVASGWVYASWGHVDRQFRWGLFASTVIIIGFFIGLPFGIIGVAAAYSASLVLLFWPAVIICFRGTPLRPSDLLRALWRPASVAVGAALMALVLDGHLSTAGVALALGRKAGLYAASFVVLWLVLPGGLRTLREQGGLLRQVFAGGGQLGRRAGAEAPPAC